METDLVEIKQELIIAPERDVTNAMAAAKALMSIVAQKKRPVIVNGEQYLEFEDWQTVGQFYGYAVDTGNAEHIEINGVEGARAKARLIDMKNGLVVGGAEAVCLRDEPDARWATKPWFQLASMAQTRAGAKAFRNRLSWVVVLAGYRPTPAEEIAESHGGTGFTPRAEDMSHFCQEHQKAFRKFTGKDGKASWYSHKLDDGTWCNEAKRSERPETPAPAEKPPVAPVDAKQTVTEQVPELFNTPTRHDQQVAELKRVFGVKRIASERARAYLWEWFPAYTDNLEPTKALTEAEIQMAIEKARAL